MSQLGDLGWILEAPDGGKIGPYVGIGDVNGDGFSDAVVAGSEPTDDEDRRYRYWRGVLYGQAGLSGIYTLGDPRLSWTWFRLHDPETDISSRFQPIKQTVALGDINRDGVGDFAVPFSAFDDGRGLVAVIFGGNFQDNIFIEDVGEDIPGVLFVNSDFPLRRFVGTGLAGGGDFNGDGRPDLAVGVAFDHEEKPTGEVYVVFGIDDPLPSQVELADIGSEVPGFVIRGPFHNRIKPDASIVQTTFGSEIHFLGDVDGDGRDDLLVEERNTTPIVRYYLIRGLPKNETPPVLDLQDCLWNSCPDNVTVFLGPDQDEDRLWLGGASGVGDIDRDDLADFVIGLFAPSRFSQKHAPRLALFLGSPQFPQTIDLGEFPPFAAATEFIAPSGASGFGGSLDAGMDFNGDEIPDMVASDKWAAGGRGEVYVLFGQEETPEELNLSQEYEGLRLVGPRPQAMFGTYPRFIGDFNGNGTSDLVALSYFAGLNSRYAYIIHGLGGGELPLTVQQIEGRVGPLRGGTQVTIRGSGFKHGARVFFGSRVSPGAVFKSTGELRTRSPPGIAPGKVDVTVEVEGARRMLPGAFEYTENLPEYDLAALGQLGFVLEGDSGGGPGSRKLTWPVLSALAFADLGGDEVDDLVASSLTSTGWQITIVHGGQDMPISLAAYEPSSRMTQVLSGFLDGARGATVASVGDINGDGFLDLGIGESDRTGYFVFGPLEAGELLIDALVVERRAVKFHLGEGSSIRLLSLTGLGDVDGDKIDDFAVGFSGGEGLVVSFAGQPAWPEEVDLLEDTGGVEILAEIYGDSDSLHLGEEVKNVGDVNGDGYTDLLFDTQAIEKIRKAYLVFGSDVLDRTPARISELVATGKAVEFEFDTGYASWFQVAGAGDVDGDGLADILIAPEGAGELPTQGITYLIFGRRQWPLEHHMVLSEELPSGVVRFLGKGREQQAGRIGPAGDYNADGYDDFMIGGPGFQETNEGGSVDLIFGNSSLEGTIDLADLGGRGIHFEGVNKPGGAGSAAGAWGDLNNDGETDFAFGETISIEQVGQRRVYVIYGPFTEKPFIRGDVNRDDNVDVSDAIFLLQYLFTGGEAPRCEDAADIDDKGSIILTDAIYLLNYLFLGGAVVPAPHPIEGKDPTEDSFNCLGF